MTCEKVKDKSRLTLGELLTDLYKHHSDTVFYKKKIDLYYHLSDQSENKTVELFNLMIERISEVVQYIEPKDK